MYTYNNIGVVTIDVEPDNVWLNPNSTNFTNMNGLLKFAKLCHHFSIQPTLLVTWSILNNKKCLDTLSTIKKFCNCEIGLHPHLWEIPPFTNIDKENIATTGLMYSNEVLDEKISNIYHLAKKFFDLPQSHRSGRWGIEEMQLNILSKYGIKVDSSIIPNINWEKTGIRNHSNAPMNVYFPKSNDIFAVANKGKILEVPCTIKPGLNFYNFENSKVGQKLFNKLNLNYKWLRAMPNTSICELTSICKWAKNNLTHINLMTHSSELVPNQSPYWLSQNAIDHHFEIYKNIFEWWNNNNITSVTLNSLANKYKNFYIE
jgi:hypothetical protein